MTKPELKIRTLPRAKPPGSTKARDKDEGKAASKDKAEGKDKNKVSDKLFGMDRTHLLVGTGLTCFCLLVSVVLKSPSSQNTSRNISSIQNRVPQDVAQKIEDSHFKQDLARRQQALDNEDSMKAARGEDSTLSNEGDRALGVQFESDDTPERLFKQLNPDASRTAGDNLPDDRINARLANRKWVNEEERQERVQYVRNYIKSAYDHGYQVQLDQNLTVVGVKKITQKVSIDQVLDRLDKQGY